MKKDLGIDTSAETKYIHPKTGETTTMQTTVHLYHCWRCDTRPRGRGSVSVDICERFTDIARVCLSSEIRR